MEVKNTESSSRMAGDFGMTMSHDIVFWNGEVSDIVFWNDEVKNLTSSFAPSGLERHGVEPLSHKSKCTRTGKQTCCRLNACVYVHVVIDHVCMCTVVIDVLFVMFCGTLFFTCFTCCDMDLTTQV